MAEMEEIRDIRLGSTVPFSDQELKRWTTLQQLKVPMMKNVCMYEVKRDRAQNQQLQILLSCRICRLNRINCALQCGHLTCLHSSGPLNYCPFCGTPIINRYRMYLHPPY